MQMKYIPVENILVVKHSQCQSMTGNAKCPKCSLENILMVKLSNIQQCFCQLHGLIDKLCLQWIHNQEWQTDVRIDWYSLWNSQWNFGHFCSFTTCLKLKPCPLQATCMTMIMSCQWDTGIWIKATASWNLSEIGSFLPLTTYLHCYAY